MKNIEEFNIAAGCIFGECYKAFPQPISIFRSDIGAAIKEGMGVEFDPDHINMNDHEYKVVEHTLSWLIQAGYIWSDNINGRPTQMNIRLSPLGFEILKSVPESLQAKENLGERLSKGVKELGKDLLFTTVNTALTMGINGGNA